MATLTEAVRSVLEEQGSRYTTEDGETVRADRLDEIKARLREKGWRKVSRLEESDLSRLGFRVLRATYASGVRPTGRYITVVAL